MIEAVGIAVLVILMVLVGAADAPVTERTMASVVGVAVDG
jgi:hypothetical protein